MILERLLHHILDARHRDAILGDLRETYAHEREKRGSAAAACWYFGEAVRLLGFAFATRRESIRALLRQLILNPALLFVLWIATGQVNGWARGNLPGGWRLTEATVLLFAAIGIPISRRLHARVALYFLLTVVAFGTAEFLIHMFYGIHWVQGAPNHFAVMIAAALGMLLGSRFVANAPPDRSTVRTANR